MSLMFKPPTKDRNFDPMLVRRMLDENAQLIKIIKEYQNKGISDFNADENFSHLPSGNKTQDIKLKLEAVEDPS